MINKAELDMLLKRNPALRISSQFGTEQIATSEKIPGKSKYGNIKTNGYDSKKEADRGFQLQCLEKAGIISDLQEQVYFELQPKYTNNQGEKIQAMRYKADFTYIQDGKKICEDVKSIATKTQVYKMKKKIFEFIYKDWIFKET